MCIQARVSSPQKIYRAEMYNVWIAAYLAKPSDSIVLDNRAAVWCVSKSLNPQSSDYELHDVAYQLFLAKLILAKSLQVRWGRGHRDPEKVHSL